MRSKRLFAMKVIDKKAGTYRRAALERELAIHGRLSHSSVVRLEGHIEDCDNHYVLTEYCEGGEMTRLLGEQLSEQGLAGVLWQVAVGLEYLHGAGVAHCDLKLSNLLLQRGQIVALPLCRKSVISASARTLVSVPLRRSPSAAPFTTWLLRS
jgi:serine/threonine protein kinase